MSETAPVENGNIVFAAKGLFKQVCVKPIKKRGRFYAKGVLTFFEAGIRIQGKRPRSGAMYISAPLIALIFISTMSLSSPSIESIPEDDLGSAEAAGRATATLACCALMMGIVYFGTKALFAKKENLFFPYADLRRFAVNPRKRLIALDFNTDEKFTPVAMRCNNWQAAAEVLQRYAPQCAASQGASGYQTNPYN